MLRTPPLPVRLLPAVAVFSCARLLLAVDVLLCKGSWSCRGVGTMNADNLSECTDLPYFRSRSGIMHHGRFYISRVLGGEGFGRVFGGTVWLMRFDVYSSLFCFN